MRPWQSIALKLPLLYALLLLGLIGAFSWMAYEQVDQAVTTAAEARLDNSARQIADLLSNAIMSPQRRIEEAARNEQVRDLIRRWDDPLREPVPDATLRQIAAQLQATLIEVWSADGERLLRFGPATADAQFDPITGVPPEAGIGPLKSLAGRVYYETAVPVFSAPGASEGSPIGWIVDRRVVSASAMGQVLAEIVGNDAVVRVANLDGGLWTDMSGVVPAPPIELGAGSGLFRYGGSDGPYLAAAMPIPGTPWVTWVEMRRESALAPAREFLSRVVTSALILLLVGIPAAFLLSRQITGPLATLASAAKRFGEGDLTVRVPADRRDELGLLSAAFNAMAERVARSHNELEDRVAERTAELRQAYQDLAEAQDALVRRERLAMLGQLASSVGHELRNPLGVMTNAVYYLSMVLKDAPEGVVEYLGILRTQIGLSEKIVSDLLDFARIKEPAAARVSVATIVNEQLTRLARPDGIEIVRDLPPDLPDAYVDRLQIGQILLNLLLNAVQAMNGRPGRLTIRARAAGPDRVQIDVADEGDGIPPELLEKIFEPLFTTKARGIGLGLSVSRTLARANRGDLTVSSPPGSGATFSLVLPTQPPAEQVE